MPDIVEIALICKEYGYTEEEYWELSEEFTNAIKARRQVEAQINKEENDRLESQSSQSS